MRHQTGFIVAGFLLAGSSGQAADNGYANARLGLNSLGDQTVSYPDSITTSAASAEFDGGFLAGGSVGYQFGDSWRLEGELIYRTSEPDRIDLPGVDVFTEGDYSSLTFGANGYYDFNLFGSDKARAHAGAGIAWLQAIDTDFEQNGIEQSFSSDDLGFQLILGARYNLGERWTLDAEARYLAATGIDMTGEDGAGGSVSADYDPLSLTVGFGWQFQCSAIASRMLKHPAGYWAQIRDQVPVRERFAKENGNNSVGIAFQCGLPRAAAT